VRTLLAAGFEGYDVDYRRGTFTYFLPSGASAQLAMPKTEGSVAAEFKAADVERAVREAQSKAPGYTYSGFCAKVKAAGCAGYMVSWRPKSWT
jgi:ABC-type Na+ efflux pump permease subunit